MKRLLLLIIPSLLLMAGCARVISDGTMRLVDRSVTFAMLRGNPDAYVGKYVLLGGSIAEVKNTREGSWLEVIQYDLDYRQTPKVSEKSGGRFLALSDTFLDPYVYASGQKVTVAGKVQGKTTRSLKGEQYTYPVIAAKEIYLHKETLAGPEYYEDSPEFYRDWGPYGGF